MVGLLRDAVRPEGESTIPAIDACFEADDAGVLEKRMRSYALECFSNGLPAHPRWLLQRMYYLFASVQFTVQLVSSSRTAGDREFEHVELYAMKSTRALGMTRLSQKLPTGDGRADEWQGKVYHKRCLAAMEGPLVSTAGSKGAGEEITMGFAFRFGLFRKSPHREKHSRYRRADPPVWVGVAEVATQAIMSGLPDGNIELDVPFTATTLRQFRRPDDEADTIAPKPTPPNTCDATKSFTKTVKRGGKEKSEKRGWLRGLVQKLHRSGDGKEQEQQQEENEGEKENNKKKEKENMMEEQMRVVVSFVLLKE
ncbi:uncharacterized protein ACA1_064950 [Acanthamoeba castellanii str. Neff]|uniref:Uncharacterized protein n=1 Tax=Acanthamoeba castellanii (strain ATCC 30010 / Neff) TaxID=1257118 RepID=L8GYU5_ACACF|nr:uncharacterized protein ACA1_064950 [Acanthamoeba castellanii str. Neff]ELR17708.1 hypothetical protein ACA1_064950 [Acanthamoeba castellanii str. Neff]